MKTVALILSIALVACGDVGGPPTPDLGEGSVVRTLASRNAVGSRERPYDSVLETMPNVMFVRSDGTRDSISDAVVVGSVVDVSPGISMTWEDGGTTRVDLPFNDDRAMVSTVHVTLHVDQVVAVGPGIELPANLIFGLAVEPRVDVDAANIELKELGTVVAFLHTDSPVFDYDRSLYAVVEDGAFLGMVDADGKIRFPAMDPVAVPIVVSPDLTVETLLAAPTDPVELSGIG